MNSFLSWTIAFRQIFLRTAFGSSMIVFGERTSLAFVPLMERGNVSGFTT
jgi:TRAP-type C4-dicarboxylate transport system permease small subunit